MSAVVSDQLLDSVNTDAVVEAVVAAPDPWARAAIIAAIIHDLCAAVEWVHSDTPATTTTPAELDGIRRLSWCADSHRIQMNGRVAQAEVTR